MGKKTKASLLTLIISIINFGTSFVFSLVYNNYLIRIYGTETNGLISTLTQFVSFFTIFEGGLTTAVIVSTYSPIVNKDYKLLNDILVTAKKMLYVIGGSIAVCSIILGSIYIKFVDSPFDYYGTLILLIISVIASSSSICLLSKYTIILQGDNKEYAQILLSLVARTVTWVLAIYLMTNFISIIIVYSINVLNVFINAIFLRLYEKKNYSYIDYNGQYKKELVKGSGDVLFQKIANTIFTSTDLVLISTMISLSFASVYNLYYQIFRTVMSLLTSIAQAPFNSFGQLAKEKNQKSVESYFFIYQRLVLIISVILLTVTGMMIVPFVSLFTREIVDFDYVYPAFAFLFFSQFFFQIANRPFGILLNATGNFKMQNKQCAIAAVVNIGVSIMFIEQLGVKSIILGSIVGTLIILVVNVYQAFKYILKISAMKCICDIIINYGVALFLIYISFKVDWKITSYIKWFLMSGIVSIFTTIVVIGTNFFVDNKTTLEVFRYIKSILDDRKK